MDLLDVLLKLIPVQYFELFTVVVALANAIVNLTDKPAPGSPLAVIYRLIEVLALNITNKSKQ